MRSSWLYLATRSPRAGAPVLIWPQLVATARSEIVVSSVSPERWLITQLNPARCARLTASRVSVTEPIWFSLTSSEFAERSAMPRRSRSELVTNRSSPTTWTRSPTVAVSSCQPALDGDDRVGVEPFGVDARHLRGRPRLALEVVPAVGVELRGGRVHRQR